MTVHKLTAGSGYEYLTRQVAALDATDKGHSGLADYYEAKGESPGQWVGSGMTGLAGLEAGDAVTAEQMYNLFGLGLHPLAEHLEAQYDARVAEGRRGNARERERAGWLGKPYAVHTRDVSPLRIQVARRVAEAGRAADPEGSGAPVPAEMRARIRTEVAREFFTEEHGREPGSERELAGFVAEQTRPRSTAVAGYDLTFSPVKSVSALWAVADPHTARMIEHAHQFAVADALAFIENYALYTRTGAGGVRQIQTTGLVAAAFTHRDSRAGDPDLHTHVAVANKVQALETDEHGNTVGGRWLAIDGRVLFKANVAASETYNTRLEHHLNKALGVRFADRPAPGGHLRGAKRAVREIVGVDPALLARWSTRRQQVVDVQTDLAGQFRTDHGRPPTPVEALHLAQQANLATRQPKHSARSEAEQRSGWLEQAVEVLGGDPDRVEAMLTQALAPPPIKAARGVDAGWIQATAATVIGELEQRRATWQTWHVRAEAERQIRASDVMVADPGALTNQLVEAALTMHSVSLAGPAEADFNITPHPALCRADGASVYTVHGSERFTSRGILAAEHRLLTHAAETGAPVVPDHHGRLAVLEAAANRTPLNRGQVALVQNMATSGRRLQLAIAAAGTGKTTALRALASAWTDAGGNVLALAPSAAAAGALTDALGTVNGGRGVHVETLAKLTHTLDTTTPGHPEQLPSWVAAIGASTLVIVDEAGMADTLTLDQVVHHAATQGATTRLVGDDQQLAAIGAGGLLRDIEKRHGALHLDELMRFADPAEANTTLQLRRGDPTALDFYLDHDRIHVGDELSIAGDVVNAWHHDRTQGLDALMLAPTRDQVRDLNQLAQALLHPEASGPRTQLADGLTAGLGDLVITRTNDRHLRVSATDWVTNGDRWHITGISDDGSLDVTHATNGLHARLPRHYVQASVELGYATTIHTAQGITTDTVHGLIPTSAGTGAMTRQDLYTMLTRGRRENHGYLPAGATTGDAHQLIHPDAIHPQTPRETLEKILGNDGAATSATTELESAHDPSTLLQQARERYDDALNLACEQAVSATVVDAVETHAEQLLPGMTEQPAWPTLRQRLIRAAADNQDPIDLLNLAADRGRLHDARDPAATLTWRLEALTDFPAGAVGELPALVQQRPTWCGYLQRRQAVVREALYTVTELTNVDLGADYETQPTDHHRAPTPEERRPARARPISPPR
ncbi:MAG: primase catalytic core, N-terminal domain [Nocardioides sp.]|nr:primase catalytic core, N-terminal domain [Nocardioides sp.]